MARLHANLAAAHEPLAEPEGDLRRRLERAALLLRGADAIAPAGDDRFQLTARGSRLLAEHADGVDESVLSAFPEFRAFLTALSPKRFEDDPRLPAFQAGMRRLPSAAQSPTIPMPLTASTISLGSAVGPKRTMRTSKGEVGQARHDDGCFRHACPLATFRRCSSHPFGSGHSSRPNITR